MTEIPPPPVVSERYASRRVTTGNQPSAELQYNVSGAATSAEARDAVLLVAPATFDGLLRGPVSLSEEGDGLWIASVRYSAGQLGSGTVIQPGETTISMSMSVGTARITQSIATTRHPITAPDYQGAIGVTPNGVAGVEIVSPGFTREETHYRTSEQMTTAYIATLFGLKGKVNSATWRGYLRGEALFVGADMVRRGTSDSSPWEVTYKFAFEPNRTNINVGGITVASKEGWQYLDVTYGQSTQGTQVLTRPTAVYVHTVYEYADFAALGI